MYKILFSNIGYAKGIDGSLRGHIERFGHHFYTEQEAQKQVLDQMRAIIQAENPDLCCFVEIDDGSRHAAGLNQIEFLREGHYGFFDIAGKYGENSWLSRMYMHAGKSNAFMARQSLPFERLYFRHGTKRLIYKLTLPMGITVLSAHFSLNRKTRLRQFREVRALLETLQTPVIILADFNILHGFRELKPLLEGGNLSVLNNEKEYTFTFHKHKLTLDLCICSRTLMDRVSLKIIPQPFSDHAALLVEISE